ncbi:MAG: FHA domain-containing protein [Polyangiaceae bacterium]|nr:FHA domain-containing protein [Polyangiaceae bacterium]
MIPGLGKQTITLGSAPSCDVVLQGPGVAPEHAQIVHQGGGRLVFIDLGVGASSKNGAQLPPRAQEPFDFRTTFACGQVPVPLSHPAIVLMLMSAGSLPYTPGQLVIGRDAARASLVVSQPSVSSQHATVTLDRMMVLDHGSTSGTYVGGARVAPGTPTPIDPSGVLAFGPVPIPVAVLAQIAQAMAGGAISGPPSVVAGPPSFAAPPPHVAPPPPPDAPHPGPQKKNQTVVGKLDFDGGSKDFRSIGRTPDNDIRLEHPQVSSRHAVLMKRGDKIFIEDRRSANGTWVRGQRVQPGVPVEVQNGEKVFIGPMPLVIQIEAGGGGGQIIIEDVGQWAGRPLFEVEAWRLRVDVPDREDPSVTRTLLDDVSFKAVPGDMIALMGPSGAGKTTLLLTLNGYKPPTGGMVRVNGEDFYSIYDVLRGSIGYVPQDDIVHPELTVFEAVRYSAKFRLPPDYSDDEIDQRVMMTLQALGLESVANLEIGKPEKKVLSGGQRKRVNIALELVTDPVILFLDEPTSGLAADDTTALISLLSDLARSTGKTVIMTIHQPAKDEYEKFNVALILGPGGVPMFFGPTAPDSYRFFGGELERQGKRNDVDNPRDMFDMLRLREAAVGDELRQRDPNIPRGVVRNHVAKLWSADFAQSETYRKMYSGPRAIGQEGGRRGVPDRAPPTSGQLGLLLSRYFKVKVRDRMGTAIMFLQAPIIGALLAIVFGGQKNAVPFWCIGALQEIARKYGQPASSTGDALAALQPTSDFTAAMFFVTVSSLWFGTSNAAREIVSERAVYLRERMVNLGLLNYVLSKFILLCLFCVVQCATLLAIVFFALGFHGGMQAFGIELANLVAVAWCSVGLGLLLSSVVESSEAAMALTPIALIPQIVLGGLIVPMTSNPALKWLMYFVPARWGFQGAVAEERKAIETASAWLIDLKNPGANSPDDFISAGKFKCAVAQLASENYNGAWGFSQYGDIWMPFAVLGGMTLGSLLVLLVFLRRRDPV